MRLKYLTIYKACPSSPIKTFKDSQYYRCVQNCSSNPSYHAFNDSCVQYCPSPYWAIEDEMYCSSECPLDTYYQIDGSERTCVDICYPNYFANSTRFCVTAADCVMGTLKYYGDSSTGKCVESTLFTIVECPVS